MAGPLLAALLLLPLPATAAVTLRVAAGPEDAVRLESLRRAAAGLLERPVETPFDGGVAHRASAWRTGLGSEEKESLLSGLRAAWGPRLRLEEEPPSVPGGMPPGARGAAARRAALAATGARLAAMEVPAGRAEQDRFYDARREAASAAARPVAPAPAARVPALAAAPPRRLAGAPPPAPTPAGALTARRALREAGKGAVQVVTDLVSWKGLAIAAGSVALVTVAPVTIYAILALGAATSGWAIGRALVDGNAARRAGDEAAFDAAAREFGRGALGLGLVLVGARHPPASLRPHVPKTSGEWRALAVAMDDEPAIAMSLMRGSGEKAQR